MTYKSSLKRRLSNYLRARSNVWINKGTLSDLGSSAGFLGETVGRRLRELQREGILEVRPGQGCNEYRYRLKPNIF